MEYVLVIHRAEGGGYRAEVPALEGCVVEADTVDGLLADAPTRISSHLASLAAVGQQPPAGQGVVIATVEVPESPARMNEWHEANELLRGECDQIPTLSQARPGRAVTPEGNERIEGEGASGVRGTLLTSSVKMPEWARVAAGVLILWLVLVSVYPLWNAWDARDGSPESQKRVPAAAAAPSANQAAPTAEPGPTATLPYAPAPVATAALPVTPVATPPAAPRASQGEYVVKPGETLWSISQRFGVTVEEVMRANDLTDRTFVRSGQRLVIPEARR